MNAIVGLLIPALVGVDFGWERKPNDTIEYIVQVDPETFAEMQRTGETIGSALPHSLRNRVSGVTFRVGTEPLPNHNTLPPEDEAPRLTDAATGAEQPLRHQANYQPPGSPGGANAWANSRTPTTAMWPAAPNGSVSTAPNSGTMGYTNPITTPTPATSTVPPVSTSGFPINPNAAPPTSSGAFPGSTIGTLPSSSTVNSAWPASTAPPSMSNGPRMSQPPQWNTPPREVAISARMPAETTGPLTSTTGQAMPNYNNNWQYQNPPATQPTYVNNYGTTPTNGGYNSQAGYNPAATPPQLNGQPLNVPPNMQPNLPPNMQANWNVPNVTPTTAQQPLVNTNAANTPKEPASPSDQKANAPPVVAADSQSPLLWAFAIIGLLTSLACNFYFGWSTYQIRERYRLLLVDRGAYT